MASGDAAAAFPSRRLLLCRTASIYGAQRMSGRAMSVGDLSTISRNIPGEMSPIGSVGNAMCGSHAHITRNMACHHVTHLPMHVVWTSVADIIVPGLSRARVQDAMSGWSSALWATAHSSPASCVPYPLHHNQLSILQTFVQHIRPHAHSPAQPTLITNDGGCCRIASTYSD